MFSSCKNLEAWKKRARKLVLSTLMQTCYPQQHIYAYNRRMSVAVLSRLLEAVAKSLKHATAMSTILAAEIFQARCDSALANSKLLVENSSYELGMLR